MGGPWEVHGHRRSIGGPWEVHRVHLRSTGVHGTSSEGPYEFHRTSMGGP